MTSIENRLNLLEDLLAKAKTQGADAADAVFIEGTSLSLAHRLGTLENLDRSEGADLGLRVFVGHSQAIVSTSDTDSAALDEALGRALAMAKSVPEDPYCGIADADQLAHTFPELEMCDPTELSNEQLETMARKAEDAARAVSGVTNSEGAEAGWSQNRVAFAASNGFAHTYASSRIGLSVSVLAGEGTAMERDYDHSSAVFVSDLMDPQTLGTSAGEKAVRRLNPRKVPSCAVPVVFDPRVSRSLLGHFSSAISGSSIARGTSFLKDKMDEKIFGEHITIVDDPHRKRGLRSAPFDDEGLPTVKRNLIDGGRLTTWLLDLRSSRQLKLAPTGHASRGVSSPPSPSAHNLYLAAGPQSPEALIGEIDNGFYVTELIGFGVNGVTGDYSRGASGFWIENGTLSYAVSEVTIAGNLIDMFANMTPANDLNFRYGTDAPTVRVDSLTLAGT